MHTSMIYVCFRSEIIKAILSFHLNRCLLISETAAVFLYLNLNTLEYILTIRYLQNINVHLYP